MKKENMLAAMMFGGQAGGGGGNLPDTTLASAGDVLGLDQNKELEWRFDRGGRSGYSFSGMMDSIITAAISYAGTAIGTTVNNPTAIEAFKQTLSSIEREQTKGRTIFFADGKYQIDVIANTFDPDLGSLTSFTGKVAVIGSGNLYNCVLNMSFTYDSDTQLNEIQIACYCDSHTITFM